MPDNLTAKLAAAQEDLLDLHREVVHNIVASSRCEERLYRDMEQRASYYNALSRKFAEPGLRSALAAIANDEASAGALLKGLPN